MCNNYRLRGAMQEIALAMGLPFEADITVPADNIFPRRPALVVRSNGDHRVADTMMWGFPPPAKARGPVTNVRNLASPFWRSALTSPARRCLIPASEFSEWEGDKGAKQQRWFRVSSLPVFALAGIWRPGADDLPPVFAMLTCDPNPLVAAVHPKAMPVVLHPEDHDRWLAAPLGEAIALAVPFPSQLMAMA